MIYAGFWKRFNAYGIDSFIVLVLYLLVVSVIGDAHAQSAEDIKALVDSGWLSTDTDPKAVLKQLGGDSDDWFSFHDVILPMIVSSIYNILFVAGKWQATPGKRWCKIKVVMQDGRKLTLLESAIRHAVSGISIWPLGVGYITMFFTKEKLALHDIICNTRVVMR